MKKDITIHFSYVVTGKRTIEVPNNFKLKGKNSIELLEYLQTVLPGDEVGFSDLGYIPNHNDEILDLYSESIDGIEVWNYKEHSVVDYTPKGRRKVKFK